VRDEGRRRKVDKKLIISSFRLHPSSFIYYPSSAIVVARELTKKFEEFHHGAVAEVCQTIAKSPIKGEITLLIAGDAHHKFDRWKEMSPKDHIQYLAKAFSLSDKEAIKLAAELRGVPKREIYKQYHLSNE